MLIIGVFISFFVTFATLPIIVRVFNSIDLLDVPNRRKVHTFSKPSLGGLSIYAGVLLALLFVTPLHVLADYKFFIAGIIISLLLGMRDDISSLYANQKLVFQLLAAFVTVYYAGISIDSLHGFFGLTVIPTWLAMGLTMFIIIVMSNSFNLIDGIDGLAGSIGLLVSVAFGTWYLVVGDVFFSIISFSLASSLFAFLIYNWHPSKIFMGDTGSIVTGFVLSVLAVKFISLNAALPESSAYRFDAFLAVAISLLILPIYDTIRVIVLRVSDGISPFFPDTRHLHHILIRQGMTHAQATLVLSGFTIFCFLLISQIQFLGNTLLITFLLVLSTSFGVFWDLRLKKYLVKQKRTASDRRDLYVSKSA
jgi:UDP-GlcNAc:undecaprenyl-phosphate GlcNAc-1-phosphate transferase